MVEIPSVFDNYCALFFSKGLYRRDVNYNYFITALINISFINHQTMTSVNKA